MYTHLWLRALSRTRHTKFASTTTPHAPFVPNRFRDRTLFIASPESLLKHGGVGIGCAAVSCLRLVLPRSSYVPQTYLRPCTENFSTLSDDVTSSDSLDPTDFTVPSCEIEESVVDGVCIHREVPKAKYLTRESIEFTEIPIPKLPTVIVVGRPNVGKSALFNRLIGRREALVYNTPTEHVTRDIRDGVAKLGTLRFRILDSAGLEAEASSGSVLGRTAAMTGEVLAKAQLALFLIDARDGLEPMDVDVGKWLRKRAPGLKTVVVMNKAESLDEISGSLAAASGEAYTLGFGDPIAVSAETGLGMSELHDSLRPFLEDYVLDTLKEDNQDESLLHEGDESKLPLQLAIVGRPNVGKSTLLNAILLENRVLVGPEAGLTRDSIRVHFQYEDRDVYLVDTAGWLGRTGQEKGPSSLSVVQSRKHLMRAQIVALVLDAEEIVRAQRIMNHAEVRIAREAVDEGRGLVVVVNKMDLLKGRKKSKIYENLISSVPTEIQRVIPQVTGIPVVFVSALEGHGRLDVMRQVIDTYEKWCLRLPTSRLNRWLHKVMGRHSWKDAASQTKIKYFTQVKARPPTFVAFVTGKAELPETVLRFLTKSLKEDFDIGGIPVRIFQRHILRQSQSSQSKSADSAPTTTGKNVQAGGGKTSNCVLSDKRVGS